MLAYRARGCNHPGLHARTKGRTPTWCRAIETDVMLGWIGMSKLLYNFFQEFFFSITTEMLCACRAPRSLTTRAYSLQKLP